MKKLARPPLQCPCDSGLAYADCCAPWHQGLDEARHAPTPEALMRSRYSAYALGLTDYLLATWHPSTAPGELEPQPFLKWLGLTVVAAQAQGDAGVVQFEARCKVNGRAQTLAETSRFVRMTDAYGHPGTRWLYIDGDVQTE